MLESFKKGAKKIFNLLPLKWRLAIKKRLSRKFSIDEVRLVFEVLKNKGNGVMFDVGAHYGGALINFLEKGWMVYSFEPNPKNLAHLRRRTKDYSNIHISDKAVSNESGKEVPLYTSEVSSGISGLSKFHESHELSLTVKTITLSDFLKRRDISEINVLKIDTEGYDLFVLEGFNWKDDQHPEIIVCEFEDRKTRQLGYKTGDIISFLEKRNYEVIISEWFPVEEYGLSHEWKRFIRGDNAETLDEDSWGNLIAFKSDSVYLNDFLNLIKSIQR
ncbi:FkbM family methyltransferase [Fodinibius sp. AD559]|uniref:FkbM family methyltransferase n=1 Tax=Fodinibius sp. AD559 TaxID=3424179 RepID=UPI004046C6BB